MKKVCFALALILTFTACSTKAPTSPSSSSTASPAVKTENELQFLSGFDGKGFYLFDDTNVTRQLPYLTYINSETATNAPVCSTEGCTHNATDCTAVFNTNGKIYSYNNGLLFFSNGFSSEYNGNVSYLKKIELPSIIITDKNGKNRKTISSVDAEIVETIPPAVYKDNLLFFTLLEGGEIALNKSNMKTGETSQLTKGLLNMFVCGIYKNNFVFSASTYADGFCNAEVGLLNAVDGSVKILSQFSYLLKIDEFNSFQYYDGKVYNLKSQKSTSFDILNSIDCETGKTVLVSDNIENNSDNSTQSITTIINDTLIIYSIQSGEDKSIPGYRFFTYNLNTNVQGEITLYDRQAYSNSIYPINTFYDIGDSVIVQQKMEYERKVYINFINNQPYDIDIPKATYAIMLKDDYLNSIPNFKTITTVDAN